MNSNFRLLNKFVGDGYSYLQVGVGAGDTQAKLRFSRVFSSSNLAEVRFSANTTVIDGNVGIGTTSPTQRLDVNGTVKATAFDGDGATLTNLSATSLMGGIVVQSNATSPNILGGYSGSFLHFLICFLL